MTQSKSLLNLSLLIFFLSLFLLFPFCKIPAVYEVSEAREGTVVQEILRGADPVLPLRYGEIIPSKPILFHWVSAGIADLRHSYDELGLRLPSALAAAGLAVVTFHIGVLLGGIEVGLLSTALLFSTYLFFSGGSDGRVDMLFCFLYTASFAAWLSGAVTARKSGKSLRQISAKNYLLAAALSGLAILTKGPLGLFLPLFSCALFAWSWEKFRGLTALVRVEWLLAPLIAVPWYYLAARVGSESFLLKQVVFENISRFFGGTGIVAKPFWFYLEHFWGEAAPCSLAFVYLLYKAWQERKTRTLPEGSRELLIWFLGMFVFFSLSVGKRRAYLLAVVAPLVVFVALNVIDRWKRLNAEQKEKIFKRVFRSAQALWIYLALVFIGLSKISPSYLPELPELRPLKISALMLQNVFTAHGTLLWTYAALIALGGIAALITAMRTKSISYLLASLWLVVIWGYLQIAAPALGAKAEPRSYRQFAATINQQVPADAPLHLITERTNESYDGLNFYLNRRLHLVKPLADWSENGWYLMPSSHPSKVSESCSKVVLSGGRMIDPPEKELLLIEVNCGGLGG